MTFISKMIFKVTGCAALLIISQACSSPSHKSSDGTSVVYSGGDSKSGYHLHAFEEKTLPNGLRILYIPDNSLPYVSFSILVRSGSAQDPKGQEGLSMMVAELLNKGTTKRSATQIATDLGNMGAEFDANAAYDYSIISASSLSPQANQLLSNVLEITTTPSFPDAEIERTRKQAMAGISRLPDNAEEFADLAFASYLYADHPYGRPTMGTLKSLSDLKKKNIIQSYLRTYRPNNAILAVVGQYTPELRAKVEAGFGAWQKRELPNTKSPETPKIEGLGIRVVDYPGLVQSQIRIGNMGIKRTDPDFLALRVGNTILGGAFASRLNDRVRKDLGLTYNIGSGFDARMETGPFAVETFTKNATVGLTVTETLKVLEKFKTQGATPEEVARTKGYLRGIFPAAIETPEKLAFNLMLLRHYGIADTYLTNYLKDIDALSVGDINRAMAKALDTKNIRVLVYSKASDVVPQLEPLVGVGKVEIIPAVMKK
jgi:zinc protease